MRTVLSLLMLLMAGSALAEPDTFGLGNGRSGVGSISAPDTVVNRYGLLTASAAAGTKEISVSNATDFVVGELVLLHHSTGLTPVPASGSQRTINLGSGSVGRFEYARVASVTETTLKLTEPLLNGYPANMTQVVSVPEYTELQVAAGASLKAAPWNGSVGGILAVLVSGTLTNEGLVTADGAGFRGGAFVNHANFSGCTELDQSVETGGSYKGEGVVAGRFGTASGRGNLANGGGGGICHNTGGGGGSHSGAGGKGGLSSDGDRDVGGLGGAPIVYLPYERLLFGGGGGAGEGDDDLGTGGGAGGGLMLIRAKVVTGAGRFSAAGSPGAHTLLPGDDGAGGGGAGGAVSIRAEGSLTCGSAEAPGGAGGDTRHDSLLVGPGGGGGGGVVFLQGESVTCPIKVLAGAPGTSLATGNSRGAGPAVLDSGSSYGTEQTFLVPFRLPATPVLSQPANGAVDLPPRPRLAGTAEPGVIIHVFLDGVLLVQLGSGTDGSFSFTPTKDLTPGAHELKVSAEVFGVRSFESAPTRFEVVTPVPDGGTPDGGSGDGGLPDGGDGGTPDGGGPELPLRPVLVVPADGEQVDPTPLFAGTSPVGVEVGIEVDEIEVGRVPLDEQGRFRFTLPTEQALAPGTHRVIARAWKSDGNEAAATKATSFEVLGPGDFKVGCGCGASPGAGMGALAVMLGLWAARRRRQR